MKEALDMMFEDMGLENKIKEAKILEAIPDVLGNAIMKRIDEYYIYQRKLFLKSGRIDIR